MSDLIKRDDAPEHCPFCGCELEQPYINALNTYRHPDNEKCFAKRAIIHPETLAAWNTRALPAIDPAAIRNAALQARIEELEREIQTLTTASIIEVAVRNPSVMDYMKHWEDRAETAEAKLAKTVEPLRTIEVDCDADYPPSHGAIKYAIRAVLAELEKTE